MGGWRHASPPRSFAARQPFAGGACGGRCRWRTRLRSADARVAGAAALASHAQHGSVEPRHAHARRCGVEHRQVGPGLSRMCVCVYARTHTHSHTHTHTHTHTYIYIHIMSGWPQAVAAPPPTHAPRGKGGGWRGNGCLRLARAGGAMCRYWAGGGGSRLPLRVCCRMLLTGRSCLVMEAGLQRRVVGAYLHHRWRSRR